MWCFGPWFICEPGSAGLTVEHDLKGDFPALVMEKLRRQRRLAQRHRVGQMSLEVMLGRAGSRWQWMSGVPTVRAPVFLCSSQADWGIPLSILTLPWLVIIPLNLSLLCLVPFIDFSPQL